jgi:hypothetical protein
MNTQRLAAVLLIAIWVAQVAGCKRKELHPHTIAKLQNPTSPLPPVKLDNAPATLVSALANRYHGALVVTIVASMPTHGYTWLRVKDDSTESWVAAPMLAVPEGASVQLKGYVPSQDIDPDVVPGHVRTVLFAADVSGDLVKLYQTGEHAAVHPLMPAGGVTRTDLDLDLPAIAKADHDIGELHVRRDELNGRIIAVRAQVVRIAPAVNGQHFVFTRDGSGDKYTSILPTMLERAVEPGDVLLLVGRFRVGAKFMYGGTHPLLLEQARIAETEAGVDLIRDEIATFLANNATPIDAPPLPQQATMAADSPDAEPR